MHVYATRLLPVVFLCCTICSVAQSSSQLSSSADYGKLPLIFEPNRGQAPSDVLAVARTSAFTALLRDGSLELRTRRGGRFSLEFPASPQSLRFESPQITKINYIRGRSPAGWILNVPAYGRVRIHRPANDVLFYGGSQSLEYDIVVPPGQAATDLVLSLGAEHVRQAGNDVILVAANGDELRLSSPRAYQRIGNRLRPVRSHYMLAGKNLRIAVGRYDHSHELVIDPVLRVSALVGGTGFVRGSGVAVDASGNAWFVGSTTDLDYPTTSNAPQPNAAGGNNCMGDDVCFDVVVSKLSADGKALLFSTYLGGTADDLGSAIAVDGAGNAYSAGLTDSADFPVTSGVLQTNFLGANCNNQSVTCAMGFVTKFSGTDGHIIYSTYLGGSQHDQINAVGVDAQNFVYVTGDTNSPDFPTTPGAYQTTAGANCTNNPGFYCGFVSKIVPDASALVFSTFLSGTSSATDLLGLALDSSHNIYVTGSGTTGYPTIPGAYLTTAPLPGQSGGVVTKLAPAGNSLIYSTFLTGRGTAIDRDSSGNVYVAGNAQPQYFVTTPGAFQATAQNSVTGFILKLNATGSALVYSTLLGQSGVNNAIKVDSDRYAYVTGYTFTNDFPTTPGGITSKCNWSNLEDAFATKLNPSGSDLVWSTCFGSFGGLTEGNAVVLDRTGNLVVVGQTDSPLFPVTPGAYRHVGPGPNDNAAFVSKLGPPCTLNSAVPSMTFCSPASGSSVSSPVRIVAGTRALHPIATITVFVDGKSFAQLASDTMDMQVPMSGGSHTVTLQMKDTTGRTASVSRTLNVSGGCRLSAGSRSVTICSPTAGSTVNGPVRVVAGTADSASVTSTQLFVDHILIYQTPTRTLDQKIPFTSGSHTLTVQGNDSTGPFWRSLNFNVTNGASSPCTLNITDPSVTICTPLDRQTVSSPVRILAGVNSTYGTRLTQLYVDGIKRNEVHSGVLDYTLSLAPGSHRITVQAFQNFSTNKVLKTINVTVR